MKTHRSVYKEKMGEHLTRYVIIRRRHSFRNKINKIMFWAHSYKWDRAYYKKYNHE